MKKIKVYYFARLREESGCPEELVETEAKTASELYLELSQKHHFSWDKKYFKVAVNEEFESWEHELHDQDSIAFIPPVAGG